jgi:hypothetical protein
LEAEYAAKPAPTRIGDSAVIDEMRRGHPAFTPAKLDGDATWRLIERTNVHSDRSSKPRQDHAGTPPT